MPKDFLAALRAGGNVAQIRLRLARKKVVGCRLSPRPGPAEGFFGLGRGGWGLLHRHASRNPQKVAESAPLVVQPPWNQAIAGARARATIVLLLTHMCGMITTKDA